MAQIWVSYSEFGELCGCSAQVARAHATGRRWPEQTGHDGVARVLLPGDLAHDFMTTFGPAADPSLARVADANVAALSSIARAGRRANSIDRTLAVRRRAG